VENIKIHDFDEALVHLRSHVDAISQTYPIKDQEDISQACWAEVFSELDRGPLDRAYLIRCVVNAASRESRALNNSGLTPRESKFRPPKQQQRLPDSILIGTKAEQIRDLSIDAKGRQRQVIEAAQLLISNGQTPTLTAIAASLGLSIKQVRTQLKHLRAKNDNDED